MATDRSTAGPSPRAVVLAGTGLLIVASGLIAAAVVHSRPRSGPAGAVGADVDHWAAVYRGRTLLQQNRPDLALRAVAHVRDTRPGAGEAMCVAGVSLARLDQIRDARIALERAVRLQPKQPMAVKTLAAIYMSLGDTDRGLEYLKKAAELSPKDPRPWSAMGKAYLDMGLNAEAATAYEASLERDPSQPEAVLGSIEAFLASGRVEDAGPLVARGLRHDPYNPRLLGLAAHQARDSGQFAEALAFAERALALDPEDVEASLTRARLRHAAGQDEAALEDANKAVTVNPNLLAALDLKMQVESSLKLADRAGETAVRRKRVMERLALMEALTQQIAARPDAAEPRWRLGQAAADGGQFVLAANCFLAALALEPRCRPAAEGLATLNAAPRLKKRGEENPQ